MSDYYFFQMIGVHDRTSKVALKDTLGVHDPIDDIINLARIKATNLFYRLLYHILTLIFLLLAIKKFLMQLCRKPKDEPKDS